MIFKACGALLFFVCSSLAFSYPNQSYEFPEGCGNPFGRQDEFDRFYEATLSSIAVEKGAQGRAVAELFATNELRKEFSKLDPSYSMENPISVHIKSQICVFEQVKLRENPGTQMMSQLGVDSKNGQLHTHLQTVAPKMLRDSKKIFLEAKEALQKKQREQNYFKSRSGIIRSATRKGRSKIQDLLR